MAPVGFLHLVGRSLAYYWRTNAAVVAGVATAVSVLAGALIVGDSVRGSLRDLVLQRIGATDLILTSSAFFRAQLAADLRSDAEFGSAFADVVPIVAVQGLATDQATGRRASRVLVYGVDSRFWEFHGRTDPAGTEPRSGRDAFISPALAREIGAAEGATLLLRVQRPSTVPLESLHGRKDDAGRTLRLVVRQVLAPADLGEFSLQPQQGDVRAAFVPLGLLQEELGVPDWVNALIVSAGGESSGTAERLSQLVKRHAALEDIGLRMRVLDAQLALSLESDAGLVDDARADAALTVGAQLGMTPQPLLTYLVNSIRLGDREIPYSLVTAMDLHAIAPDLAGEASDASSIVLNEWAARDLAAKVGDSVTLEYYVWEDPGQLVTRTAAFRLARVVPMSGVAADRDLAPEYPGITETETFRDWDPPFPIDLRRVRPVDEQYWQDYRTTPKAFVSLSAGQGLWRSRYGALTSIRFAPGAGSVSEARDRFAATFHTNVDPLLAGGLSVSPVRAEGLEASRGATNFGEYFTYFSFFLVVSAVMLAALFFKLGVEQRVREVGLLRAVGFTTGAVRRLFAAEALVLAVAGSALGAAGAVGYGAVMMTGLRTWWVDAVGTTALSLHIVPLSLVLGAAGGVLAAVACIWWTLGTLANVSERSLLSGQLSSGAHRAGVSTSRPAGRFDLLRRRPHPLVAAAFFAVPGVVLLILALGGLIGGSGAFFGAGALLLCACLSVLTAWLRKTPATVLAGHGWLSISRLGVRNAGYRPSRSVLAVAVMASATFVLISVDAFRRDEQSVSFDVRSGTGGYALFVETLLPIVHDPNSAEGRELLGVSSFDAVLATPFRVRPGDDASCLNLYAPRQPRILGASRAFVMEGRFAFRTSLARSDEERENPWLLLLRDEPDGAIPIIADANSMTYVLHRAIGDEIAIDGPGGQPVRLRLVAALSDSILQGELVMSEANFLELFPGLEGYRLLLVSAPVERADEVLAAVEDRLADAGADATPTAERLAEFHRVENTYLSTFQTLGGLGLLLGTVGLAAVLLRNVFERRKELALLEAVGYGRRHLFAIVVAESTLLLACGLAIGAVCALVAIAPAAMERGGALPTATGTWLLLLAVFAAGLASSIVATRAAVRTRLLEALRAE